jgi:diguanylate cyclase (GGDEF)-like protein
MDAERIESLEHRVEALELENERLQSVDLAQANQRIDDLLSQLHAVNESLERQVRHDGLTGVANRRFFDAQLEHEFARIRRFGRALSVVLLDVDGFARINDLYSRSVGDLVLQNVAQIMRRNCRSIDIVARSGSDEFAVLLVETPENGAARVVENFRSGIESFDWGIVHPELAVTVSIGMVSADAVSSSEALMGAVSASLEAARREGRNAAV